MSTYKKSIDKLIVVAILMGAGCAGTPPQNPTLEEARAAYAAAADDPQVANNAPVPLQEAQETLRRAEQSWQAKEEAQTVNHLAYLAKQRTAIARERAELAAAEKTIDDLSEARSQAQLDARTREAERAQQRAQELSRQLEELQAKQTERGLVLTLGDVLFDTAQASLKSGAMRTISKLAEFLKENPERNILVEGHTDNRGSESYNIRLSEQRAEAVQDALAAQGIDSSRIRALGYGEEFPVASNDTAAGQQQNRRVEVIISDQGGNVPERGQF